MRLRPYQERAVSMLYDWFETNHEGHPVLNMPGGSGKSVVIASIVKDALTNWPETRVLMVVHSRELISQNADKLRKLWPGAPLGVYSASLGRREMGEPITYAGIGSVAKRAKELGHIDICLVDEAHAISTTETGMYRKLLSDLFAINPRMRVVGFSASPYRLGQGMLTDGDSALFSAILEPVSIEELVFHGHLFPLRSKTTRHALDTAGLKKSRGEFVAADMERRFNTEAHNVAIVDEIIERATDRAHWLVFCSGVAHSAAVADAFQRRGIAAESLTGEDSKGERERKLRDFESGKLRALCNVGILTTGYDFPELDCIAFLRATTSPGLYLQMAVRGMRPKKNAKDCLVLDFAGVVATHGPITAIEPPTKAGEKTGEAPVKVCDGCGELVHPTARTCPACGFEFPAPPEKKFALRNDDIMGSEGSDLIVSEWEWKRHTSASSGREMLRVRYYGGLADPPVDEYVCIMHEGYAGEKARRTLARIASDAGLSPGWSLENDLDEIARALNAATPPSVVTYEREGKFFKVKGRTWSNSEA